MNKKKCGIWPFCPKPHVNKLDRGASYYMEGEIPPKEGAPMRRYWLNSSLPAKAATFGLAVFWVVAAAVPARAQWPAAQPGADQPYNSPPAEPQVPPPANAPRFSPDQLDDLVAPIALYPDPMLSQVLVASTYPLELVEAEQWMKGNPNLRGQQLMDASRQQNWDASVAAMVAFPDVLDRLTSNIRWTTDL